MYYHMFPQEVIDLQEELKNHPALMANLARLPADATIDEKVGEVAAFCGMVLDGHYDEKEVLKICEIATKKLIEARTELVRDILAPIQPTAQ